MFWLCRNTHRRAEAAPGAVTLLAKASILVPRPFATCIRWERLARRVLTSYPPPPLLRHSGSAQLATSLDGSKSGISKQAEFLKKCAPPRELKPSNPSGATGQCSGEFEQSSAQRRVVDPVIGADQLHRLTPAKRIGVEWFGRGFSKPRRGCRCPHRVHVVEKK
jgi:hypothetical protein